MKRKAVLYKSSTSYNRHICIDENIAETILDLIAVKKIGKKFDYIVNRILEQNFIYYDDYVKLKAYKSLSEMRLFPNGANARIYCKEVNTTQGKFYVVVAKFLEKKKSDPLNKKIDNLIKPIEDYEYEFE